MTENRPHTGTQVKPGFIIIGAQKCGTSTMFRNLGKHPGIQLPGRKELHFFDENYSRGLDWYLHFFNKKEGPGAVCSGEASPYYFFHPLAPSRIFETFPQIRLILLLRNPVNRAYSQYYHMKRKGRVSLSFEHCITLEERILEGRKEAFYRHEDHSDLMYRRFSFLSRSRYAEQLSEWMKYFPLSQILIIRSEDYFLHTEQNVSEVFHFLGLPAFTVNLSKKHESPGYPPVNAETRARLVTYFEPFNQQLYGMIGRDFGWK
ncbi:MAG: sulfotransferase domain-containing protein [Bacteroidetes bacterium]|nr:sulfotransferase domain-containing protein [Bacteroidota bacterium]